MPTMELTATVSISLEYTNLEAVEEQIHCQLRQVGQQMLVQACQQVEQQSLKERGQSIQRQRQEPRHLLSRFGWVRLWRYRVKEADGHSHCLLDEVLGLEKRQHASPWARERAMYFVTQLPYRPAAAVFSQEVGESVDHRTLWSLAQKEGEKLVAKQEQEWKAVFEDGEVPVRDEKEREMVVAEVDGTFLAAQREEQSHFEVRLGVMFSGRELESQTAKHQRYRLVERLRYGGVEEADPFGEKLFLRGEKYLGLSKAKNLLLVGDGASWIEHLAGGQRYKATYHLDWRHVQRRIGEAFGDAPEVGRHLVDCLRQQRPEDILRAVKLRLVRGQGLRERLEDLQDYLERNWRGLYGSHSLAPRLSAEARKVLVVGSGAVEKHIGLVICRRMKGQGMRWTRKGANHLLKLRLQRLEEGAVAV